jgi:hypothetical protein
MRGISKVDCCAKARTWRWYLSIAALAIFASCINAQIAFAGSAGCNSVNSGGLDGVYQKVDSFPGFAKTIDAPLDAGEIVNYSIRTVSGPLFYNFIARDNSFEGGRIIARGADSFAAGNYLIGEGITGLFLQINQTADTFVAVVNMTCTPLAAPTLSSFTYGTTVAYGSTSPTSINVATLGSVTGTATDYYIGGAGTATTGGTTGGGTVSISTAGVASYTPAPSFRGTDTFQVRARNSGGTSSAAIVTVNVGNPTLSASVPTATGTVGTAYSQQVTITGGTGPYSGFSATGLPAGLNISSSGLISGTPTTAGAASATITVTDSSTGTGPFTGSASLTITIGLGTQIISFISSPPSPASVGGQYTVSASGGGSGNPVVLSIDPASAAGACSINSSTVSFTGLGSCIVAANQAGNINYQPAVTAKQTIAVQQADTTTTLDISTAAPLIGEPVTFTVSVTSSAGTPSGSVSIKDGGVTICTVTLSNGTGSCSAPFASGGSHNVTAIYSGAGNFSGSSSQPVSVSVTDQVATTTRAIGAFLSERNNQILSNEPNSDRQIDRLQSYGGSTGGGSAGIPPASGLGGPVASSGESSHLIQSFGSRGRLGTADERSGLGGPSLADTPAAATGATLPMQLRFGTSLSSALRASSENEQRKIAGLAPMGLGRLAKPSAPVWTPFDIWVEGRYAQFRDDAQGAGIDGHFGLVSVGADYVLNRSLLIGAMVQYDDFSQSSGGDQTDVSGHGYLAGPYATLRLTDNMFWQLRGAWGRSWNDVSPFMTYTDSFTSTRWLVSSTLSGRWQAGAWTLKPSATLAYIEDASDAYHDTFGVLIPKVTSSLGQFKVGPVVSYRAIFADGTVVEPYAGIQVIGTLAHDTDVSGLGAIDGDAAGPSGARGKIELGIKSDLPAGLNLDVSGSYDGVGASDYSAVSGRAAIRVPLN